MPEHRELLPELERIVKEAGAIALDQSCRTDRRLKADGSIVTSADERIEDFLRDRLQRLIPDSGFWGEESGFEDEGLAGLWLVDPVDGTSNYCYGSPLWGISVAFSRGNAIELGAVFLPDLNEMYMSARGDGVRLNGSQVPPIPEGRVRPEHLVSYCEQVLIAAAGAHIPGKMRCSGAFVIDGTFTLSQRYRGMIGVREMLYDAAACMLMGKELGAEVRYADGTELHVDDLRKNEKIGKPWLIFPRNSAFFLK